MLRIIIRSIFILQLSFCMMQGILLLSGITCVALLYTLFFVQQNSHVEVSDTTAAYSSNTAKYITVVFIFKLFSLLNIVV